MNLHNVPSSCLSPTLFHWAGWSDWRLIYRRWITYFYPRFQGPFSLVHPSAQITEGEVLCQQTSLHCRASPSWLPQSQTGKLVWGATSTNPQPLSRQSWCTALLLSLVLSPCASTSLLFSCVIAHVHRPPVFSIRHTKHESVQTGRVWCEFYTDNLPTVNVSDKETHSRYFQGGVIGVHQNQGSEIEN